MKKKVRKHIKEDRFVDSINKMIEYIQHNKKAIMWNAAGILAVAVIAVGIRYLKASSASNENRILSQILNLREEVTDHPEKLPELEKLAGGGKFSRMAYISLASYWIEQGNFKKAEEELKKIASGTKDVIYYQSRDMLAQIYLAQKKYDEALVLYEEMEKNPGDYAPDVIIFHKAEVMESIGDADKALLLFKKFQEEYPQTYYGYEASKKDRKHEEKK